MMALIGCGTQSAGVASGQGDTQSAGGNAIKIGVPLPLTGSEATYGKDMLNAMNLAVDQINAKGGVLGKKLAIVSEDDGADPQMATAAANKLISEGIVAVVGSYTSGSVMPVMSIYNEKNLPYILPDANSTKIAEQNPGNTFEINGTAFHQAQKAVELFKKLGVKNLAIIDQGDAYSADLENQTQKAWAAAGHQLVAHETTNKGEQDFSSVVTDIKSKNADMVFWTAYYADGGMLIKQLRQAGYNGDIVVGDGSCDPQLISISGPASEGTYVLSPPTADVLPNAQKFVSDYKAKFNANPGPYAPLSYDAINLLADAMKRAGTTDGKAVIKALKETKDFPGLAGKINFKSDNTLLDSNFVVLQVKNGKFVPVNI
jgi:branched-chain amino acid transport system substrate-binding protein